MLLSTQVLFLGLQTSINKTSLHKYNSARFWPLVRLCQRNSEMNTELPHVKGVPFDLYLNYTVLKEKNPTVLFYLCYMLKSQLWLKNHVENN